MYWNFQLTNYTQRKYKNMEKFEKLTDWSTVGLTTAAQATNWIHRWCCVLVTNAQINEPLLNLPAHDRWILFANLLNFGFDVGCGVARLWTTNYARPYWSSLLVTIQYFRYTTVRDAQLSADVAWSNSLGGHFNDLQALVIWQWSAIDENTTKLVNSSLTWTFLKFTTH